MQGHTDVKQGDSYCAVDECVNIGSCATHRFRLTRKPNPPSHYRVGTDVVISEAGTISPQSSGISNFGSVAELLLAFLPANALSGCDLSAHWDLYSFVATDPEFAAGVIHNVADSPTPGRSAILPSQHHTTIAAFDTAVQNIVFTALPPLYLRTATKQLPDENNKQDLESQVIADALQSFAELYEEKMSDRYLLFCQVVAPYLRRSGSSIASLLLELQTWQLTLIEKACSDYWHVLNNKDGDFMFEMFRLAQCSRIAAKLARDPHAALAVEFGAGPSHCGSRYSITKPWKEESSIDELLQSFFTLFPSARAVFINRCELDTQNNSALLEVQLVNEEDMAQRVLRNEIPGVHIQKLPPLPQSSDDDNSESLWKLKLGLLDQLPDEPKQPQDILALPEKANSVSFKQASREFLERMIDSSVHACGHKGCERTTYHPLRRCFVHIEQLYPAQLQKQGWKVACSWQIGSQIIEFTRPEERA